MPFHSYDTLLAGQITQRPTGHVKTDAEVEAERVQQNNMKALADAMDSDEAAEVRPRGRARGRGRGRRGLGRQAKARDMSDSSMMGSASESPGAS